MQRYKRVGKFGTFQCTDEDGNPAGTVQVDLSAVHIDTHDEGMQPASEVGFRWVGTHFRTQPNKRR